MSEVHICRGVNRMFYARVRQPHHKKAMPIGNGVKSSDAALRRLVRHMTKYPGDGSVGDVIMAADYYDPHQIFRLERL